MRLGLPNPFDPDCWVPYGGTWASFTFGRQVRRVFWFLLPVWKVSVSYQVGERGNYHMWTWFSPIQHIYLTPYKFVGWFILTDLDLIILRSLQLNMMSNQLQISTSKLHIVSKLLCWISERAPFLPIPPPSQICITKDVGSHPSARTCAHLTFRYHFYTIVSISKHLPFLFDSF